MGSWAALCRAGVPSPYAFRAGFRSRDTDFGCSRAGVPSPYAFRAGFRSRDTDFGCSVLLQGSHKGCPYTFKIDSPLFVFKRKGVRYLDLKADRVTAFCGRTKSSFLQRRNRCCLKPKPNICLRYNILRNAILINSCL